MRTHVRRAGSANNKASHESSRMLVRLGVCMCVCAIHHYVKYLARFAGRDIKMKNPFPLMRAQQQQQPSCTLLVCVCAVRTHHTASLGSECPSS